MQAQHGRNVYDTHGRWLIAARRVAVLGNGDKLLIDIVKETA